MNAFVQPIKDKISKYFHIGVSTQDTMDEIRKLYLINTFNFIAILFVFPFGLNALLNGAYPLAVTLLGISFILTFNYFFLKVSDHPQKKDVSSYIISLLLFILMSYLIYSGGVNNTGPLWCYPLPLIVLFLLGFMRGLLLMVLFFIVIGFILFGVDVTTYTHPFKIRILFSLILVTFLASMYEYLRENSFDTLHELSQRLEDASHKDPLTNVYNRRGIHKEIENLCQQYKKDNDNFSLMICDIDYFKNINDTHGHLAGDEVLKKVVNEISNVIRKNDILGRWGGEEFLVLLPNATLEGAYEVAEKIRDAIENTSFKYNDTIITLTISIGIAENNEKVPIADVIKKADEHMYMAKNEGRNTVFPKSMSSSLLA